MFEDITQHSGLKVMDITEGVLTQPFLAEANCSKNINGEYIVVNEPPPNFEYENQSDRFLILDSDKTQFYSRQYCHYYRMREAHLHNRVLENGRLILGDATTDLSLSEVNQNEKCFVIGAVIKRMQNRMAVLKDLEDEDIDELEVAAATEDELDTFALDTDYIDFEDSHKQTVTLKGNLNHYKLVTGMIVGIYGVQVTDNIFEVEQIILPSLPTYIERPLLNEDMFIVLASGFNVAEPCSSLLAELTFFNNVLTSKKYHNRVARLIFAGNHSITFCQCESCRSTSINNVMPIGLSHDADKGECALKAVTQFRNRFPHIDIDIMPGEGDPCSLLMPQQPLNKALFEPYPAPSRAIGEEAYEPENMGIQKSFNQHFDVVDKEQMNAIQHPENVFIDADQFLLNSSGLCSGRKRNVHPVTNPYEFKVMGVSVLGTSGQNVNAFRKLTKKDTPTVEIMQNIIETGIVVPTAPDFTDCFPYSRNDGKDPLAFDQLPHIFFAGNQNDFATKLLDFGDDRKVRVVSIPKFDDLHSMIAVNLRTLECSRIVYQSTAVELSDVQNVQKH